MACLRRADVVGLDFPPLNVRAQALPMLAGGFGILPVVLPSSDPSSTSESILSFDFAVPGGVSWRRIS